MAKEIRNKRFIVFIISDVVNFVKETAENCFFFKLANEFFSPSTFSLLLQVSGC